VEGVIQLSQSVRSSFDIDEGSVVVGDRRSPKPIEDRPCQQGSTPLRWAAATSVRSNPPAGSQATRRSMSCSLSASSVSTPECDMMAGVVLSTRRQESVSRSQQSR